MNRARTRPHPVRRLPRTWPDHRWPGTPGIRSSCRPRAWAAVTRRFERSWCGRRKAGMRLAGGYIRRAAILRDVCGGSGQKSAVGAGIDAGAQGARMIGPMVSCNSSKCGASWPMRDLEGLRQTVAWQSSAAWVRGVWRGSRVRAAAISGMAVNEPVYGVACVICFPSLGFQAP
jgi:hypothetical protein